VSVCLFVLLNILYDTIPSVINNKQTNKKTSKMEKTLTS